MQTRAQRRRNKPSAIKRWQLDGTKHKAQLDFLFHKYKGICQLCFKYRSRRDASREHIKDLALCTVEEARDLNNMVLAHQECNNRRHGWPKHLTFVIGDL